MNNQDDNIYSKKLTDISDFKFDRQVADVFENMISRSVPGYQQILSLLPTLVQHFAKKNQTYYDLGCSLGAGMLALAKSLHDKNSTVIGIDNSVDMLEQAKPVLGTYAQKHNINFDLILGDITQVKLEPSAMVIMNFTLQFIPIKQRDELINKIHRSLSPKGVLILSEKIHFPSSDINNLLTDIHHQYKSDQGYSQLEISQKRDAIENVLIPESLEQHTVRLHNAGFSTITPWIQNLQFMSIIALK